MSSSNPDGKLGPVLDALMAIESATLGAGVRIYDWKPAGNAQFPHVHHAIKPGGSVTPKTSCSAEEDLTILARVMVRHTNAEDDMKRLVELVDQLRPALDMAVWQDKLTAKRAMRVGLATRELMFGDIYSLGIELPIQVVLDVRLA